MIDSAERSGKLPGLLVTLAPGEECEGNAFGSVCLSERVTQTIVALIGFIFLHRDKYIHGSVIL